MTLVERLVHCPSVSGSEADVARVIIREMHQRGYSIQLDTAGNVLGTIGNGPTRVYLVGHMDTVPGDLPIAVADGVLTGRGSVDAKGPLATCIEAAAAFVDSPALTITVIGCVREETDSAGARHVLDTQPAPDALLIAEPSGWNGITLGYKGALPVRYRSEKGTAHHGAPQSTAAEDAVAFHSHVCSAFPDRGIGFDDVSIRLTSICSRQVHATEHAELRLDVRTPPGFDESAFRRLVKEAAGEAGIEFSEHTPAVLRGKRNGLVRALLSGIRAQEGRPVFKRKTGTSDMNLFQTWDVPMAAYGPGDSSLDHTPNERLCLAEYQRSIAVLQAALETLGQSSEPAVSACTVRGEGTER